MAGTAKTPITAAALNRILRDLDDATRARIIATGASEAEVLQAQQWLAADDDLNLDHAHGKSGVVGAVYEILLETEASLDDVER